MKRDNSENNLSSGSVKLSGFNTQIPYFTLVRKVFSFFGKDVEGAYSATFGILINYFKLMEGIDTGSPDSDPYIYLKMGLMKTKGMPLFPGYSAGNVDTVLKEYQYIKLLLRSMGQLFLDLSDAANISGKAVEGVRSLMHLERNYVERVQFITYRGGKKVKYSGDDVIEYFSSSNTLALYLDRMISRKYYPEKIRIILEKIYSINAELHNIVRYKLGLKYSDLSLGVQDITFTVKRSRAVYA